MSFANPGGGYKRKIMSIVLICLASLVTAFYIAAPFWRVRREQHSPRAVASRALSRRQAALAALQARRDNLLREIKDLEFDRRMGKMDKDEHDAIRAELAAQAKAVLGQIETLRADSSSHPSPKRARKTAPRAIENQLELEIESEILIARARHRLSEVRSTESARWRCDCGRTMQASDAFCASCGAPRPRETAEAATA